MMKPQNQRHNVLSDMQSHKSLLHGVEGMKEGQLGTTIYDDDLKDQDKTWVESAVFQYNLNNLMFTKSSVMPWLSLLALMNLYIFLWTSVVSRLRNYGQCFNLTFPSNRK